MFEGLQPQLSYTDAIALMKAHAAHRQAAMYVTGLALTPSNADLQPFQVQARATYTDFFPMFQVPFRFGAPWSSADDEGHADVVVISYELNDKVFGGANSVGKTVNLDNHDYRVVGVLNRWQPTPKFYDSAVGVEALPFTGPSRAKWRRGATTIAPRYWCAGEGGCRVRLVPPGELPTPPMPSRPSSVITRRSSSCVPAFRWPSAPLRDVRSGCLGGGDQRRQNLLVSFNFLLVCLLNAMGLMLAKIAGVPPTSVRHA